MASGGDCLFEMRTFLATPDSHKSDIAQIEPSFRLNEFLPRSSIDFYLSSLRGTDRRNYD